MVAFNEDGIPIATNHLGWNVEKFTGEGWKPVFPQPCKSKRDARECMVLAQMINPGVEFRVYEAIEFPPAQ